MKKLLCLFLTLCVVLSLVACGGAGLSSDPGKAPADTKLTKEKLRGTWALSVSLKEKMPALLVAMNEMEDASSQMPQEIFSVITDAIPADAVFEFLLVFDDSGYRMVIDGEKLNDVMRRALKSVASVEVLSEGFRIQNLTEEEIRQRCGGLSIEEYVELMHMLLVQQIDFVELFSATENVTVRDGVVILPAENYRIDGNTLHLYSGEAELCLLYDGQKLTVNEITGAEDNAVVSALLPLSIHWVSTKTEY